MPHRFGGVFVFAKKSLTEFREGFLSADATVYDAQNEHDDGNGNVNVFCQGAEPLGQRLLAAQLHLALELFPAQNIVNGDGSQKRPEGNDDDGDEVHPGTYDIAVFHENADTQSNHRTQDDCLGAAPAELGLPGFAYRFKHIDQTGDACKGNGQEEYDGKQLAERHLCKHFRQCDKHQRGTGAGLDAESEHGGHDGQCGHHGCTGIKNRRGHGCLGDILVFAQVGAVHDHAGAGNGQGEEGLSHGHDPGVGVCQVFPLWHEQELVACCRAGQEKYTDSNDDEQHEEGGHHDLVDLFNALGGPEQQNAAGDKHHNAVTAHIAEGATHFAEKRSRIGSEQLTGQGTQQTPENPADDDGVAQCDAQRTEQRDPAHGCAQLALASAFPTEAEGAQSAGLCHTSDGKFCAQTHQTEQYNENDIRNQERSAAVLAWSVGEQLKIGHGQLRSHAGQNEAYGVFKSTVAMHCICIMLAHIFLL